MTTKTRTAAPTATATFDGLIADLTALKTSTNALLDELVEVQAALVKAELENKRLTDLLDSATAPTPVQPLTLKVVRKTQAAPKADNDDTDTPKALDWIKARFPAVIRSHLQNSLAYAGYLERIVSYGRPAFMLTDKGQPFFIQRPYQNCPNHQELFITPAGMAEVDRLYTAGLLITRSTGRTPA